MPANPTTTAVLELNAVDNTTAVLKKVGSATDGLAASYGKLQGVLGSLGVGLSVGYFASVMKGSIDAMDHLNDLAKTANLTVEAMAGLGIASKQSGGDLDSVAASLNKLSVNMGKEAEKFARLGVTAKDPLEAFAQLADVFMAIQDPQLRAAVGAEALGKSWAGAAPLLLEGGKRMREMVEEGTRAAGVTGEMARQSDEFNDKLGKLVGTGRLAAQTIGPLLPLMNMLADDMLRARDGAKGFNDGISPLLEMMKVLLVLASDVSFVFTQMGKDIARAFENVRLIAKGDWAGSRALGDMFRKEGLEARQALDDWQKRVTGIGTRPAGSGGAAESVSAGVAAAAAARGAAFVGSGKSVEDTDAAYRGLLKTLKEKLLVDSELTEVAKLQLSLDAMSAKNLATITPAREKELKGLAAELDLRKRLLAQMENTAKNEDALQKIRDEGAQMEAESDKARIAAYEANQKTIEQIQFETSIMGLSNEARETAIALRALELSGIKESDSAYAGEAERLRQALFQRQAAQKADEMRKQELEDWKTLWSTVEQTGKNVFVQVFSHGKTAFEGIGKAIKASIIDMLYQLTARKWILQIGTSLAGSLGISTAASAADGLGGIGGIANLAGLGNHLFGGGGTGGMLSGLLGSPAVPIVDAMGMGLTGNIAGSGLLGSLGGAGAGISAALPWVGGALAVGSLMGLFGGGGGGPKPSMIGLTGSPGQFQISANDIPGGENYNSWYSQINQEMNSAKYDQATLSQAVGWIQGTPGESAESMFQKFMARIQPAADAAAKAQGDAAQKQLDAAQRQVQLAQRDEQLSGQLAASVRGLADQLGIGTLKSAIGGLGVSEYLSPMDRLAGARSQFDTALAGARGGDLASVNALPDAVQTLLGVGRDVFASGGGFQDLFREANMALGEVLGRQQDLQSDILKDVPVTIMEASRDQVAELRKGFAAMTEELAGVRTELRQLRAAA